MSKLMSVENLVFFLSKELSAIIISSRPLVSVVLLRSRPYSSVIAENTWLSQDRRLPTLKWENAKGNYENETR